MPVSLSLKSDAVNLLKQLIAIPSFSREEQASADLIQVWLEQYGIPTQKTGNNVLARTINWNNDKPVLLLNSHHDTVKPVFEWKRNPFVPVEEEGKLFGLGSNDAGASLVALMALFVHLYENENLPYRLLFVASAEEEISGKNGIEAVLPELGNIDIGIVGEPTGMQMAIAEKGLLVIDAEATGQSGHAARNEGLNAIYLAMDDINWLREFKFENVSELLGPVKMTVTQIEAGTQHNVIPDSCRFVIDIRTNELYSNEMVFDVLQKHMKSKLKARSFRLSSSRIDLMHPLVQRGLETGLKTFGSPTLSDQALMPFPTLKIGPGESARSHTADEFVYIREIYEGIDVYEQLIAH